MELKYVEAFLKVIEKKSFNEAATALYITQPSLSARIQRLEEELGTPLFVRMNGRKTVLTEAGEHLFPFYSRAYELIREGNEVVQQKKPQEQHIVISCPTFMGESVAPCLLKTLKSVSRETEFELHIQKPWKVIGDIRDGNADIGILYQNGELQDGDLPIVKVADEEILLVAAPDHPLKHLGTLKATNLKDVPVIGYFKTMLIVDLYLKEEGLPDYTKIEVENLPWIKEMVKDGTGVSFLQWNAVKDDVKNNKLIVLPLEKSLMRLPISIVFRKSVPECLKRMAVETAKSIFNDKPPGAAARG